MTHLIFNSRNKFTGANISHSYRISKLNIFIESLYKPLVNISLNDILIKNHQTLRFSGIEKDECHSVYFDITNHIIKIEVDGVMQVFDNSCWGESLYNRFIKYHKELVTDFESNYINMVMNRVFDNNSLTEYYNKELGVSNMFHHKWYTRTRGLLNILLATIVLPKIGYNVLLYSDAWNGYHPFVRSRLTSYIFNLVMKSPAIAFMTGSDDPIIPSDYDLDPYIVGGDYITIN